MSFGVTVLFVLAIASQVAENGAWASEGACAPPGALREEPAGALSVCAASGDGYAWTPAAAAAASLAAPRAGINCTGLAGQWVCDNTCASNGVCLANGQWVVVQDCAASSLVCLNSACTIGSIADCPTLDNTKCVDSGIYPSLVDCSLYYTCDSSLTGIGAGSVQSCPSGFFYDACLKDCGIIASDTCSWADSNPCAVPGAIGVAPNNDRLYYVCATNSDGTTYQLWRKCPTGHFSLTTLTCERADEPGCGSRDPTTSTTETITTETTVEETTITAVPPPFKCSRPGINANPVTNCSFYYCYTDDSFILIICEDGYHFDNANARCILGQCTP